MGFYKKMRVVSIPLIAGFFLFYIIPFFLTLYYSLIESAFSSKWVGMQNYTTVINNRFYQLALVNTLSFMLGNVPILILFSLVLAFLLQTRAGHSRVLRAGFILPILIPSAAVIPLIQRYFVDLNSPAQLMMMNMGFSDSLAERIPLYLLFQWKNAGFHIIILMSALLMIPRDVYEAADIDGARGLRRFTSITLPLILPSLFFSTLMAVVQSLRIFKEAYLLFGPYPGNSVYTVQHYMNNHFFKLNYQNLSSGGIMFAVLVYLIVAVFYSAERRVDVAL